MKFISKAISATCIEYSFGSSIDKKISEMVLKVYSVLPKHLELKRAGIIDIIPSYTALAVHFDTSCALLKDPHAYDEAIEKAMEERHSEHPLEHTVYVNYDGEDINEVCETLKISKSELINLHTGAYPIAMIGFREYFPYLLGLDKKLNIPRRDTPRNRVKKGSVAIAAGQTGIYPEDSPGGWHIIGHTDFDDFSSLSPSDIIIFKEGKTC